jgi:hypothetical protein
MIKSWGTNNEPDTLMTINLSNLNVTKDTISRGWLFCPEFHNEKIYGISSHGIVAYNLSTHQLSVVDGSVTAGPVVKAGFKHASNEYIFLKDGPNQSNTFDTLCRYNITTGMLASDTIPSQNDCFDYCEGSDKAYMVAAQVVGSTVVKGVYTCDLSTNDYTLGDAIYNAGVMAGVSTTDPVNNKYYFIQIGNFNTSDTIMCYTESTGVVTKTPITKNSIANIEFFPHAPTSVEAINNNEAFSIYPNPATDNIIVQLAYGNKATATILDMNGVMLISRTVSNTTNVIDVRSLVPGNYIITVDNEGKKYTQIFGKH